MKVDFKKIAIKGIEGNDIMADFQKQLGNQLYMQGRNIEECELGKRIYFAEEGVELTDADCETIKLAIQGYSYVARSGIENAMKGGVL